MSAVDRGEDGFEGDDVLAGEYVLGVQDAEVRRAVEIRIARDPEFAALVSRWEEEFSTLNAAYRPENPRALLYQRIESRLFPEPGQETPYGAGLWNSLAFWRGMALASLVLAVGLVFANAGLWTAEEGEDAPSLVAELTAEGSPVNLVAAYDAEDGAIAFTPVAVEAPQSLEVWLIESDDAAPVSLGVVPETGRGEIVIEEALRAHLTEGVVLAISLEPQGGSPTGAPTGPVVAAGQVRAP